jgi:hypothetical protein
MAKYFNNDELSDLNEARKRIFVERELIYKKYGIDLLDTDSMSSLSIYEIVKQYDSDYNINFSRNGEDAISNGVLVEQKATKIDNDFTKTGKIRKNAGTDAQFQFHANGDIIHSRYVLVARRKENLDIVRIYDVSSQHGCKVIQTHLEAERDKWRNKGMDQKRDVILLPEKLLLSLPLIKKITISGVNVRLS